MKILLPALEDILVGVVDSIPHDALGKVRFRSWSMLTNKSIEELLVIGV